MEEKKKKKRKRETENVPQDSAESKRSQEHIWNLLLEVQVVE